MLYIKLCFLKNSNIVYEVGTEEAIFKYEVSELDWFLNYLQEHLSEQEYNQIKYAVVQSGTRLNLPTRTNVGNFNNGRLLHFVDVVKSYGLMSKEHNGDYLIDSFDIEMRYDSGLDAINIAPEFGQIESEFYLEQCKGSSLFDVLYEHAKKIIICLDPDAWDDAERLYHRVNCGKLMRKVWVIKLEGNQDIADLKGDLTNYKEKQLD